MSAIKFAMSAGSKRVPPTPVDELLWDVDRAAEYLGMSKHWVYRAVAAGALPHRKIGASVRFMPSELRSWANRQQ